MQQVQLAQGMTHHGQQTQSPNLVPWLALNQQQARQVLLGPCRFACCSRFMLQQHMTHSSA